MAHARHEPWATMRRSTYRVFGRAHNAIRAAADRAQVDVLGAHLEDVARDRDAVVARAIPRGLDHLRCSRDLAKWRFQRVDLLFHFSGPQIRFCIQWPSLKYRTRCNIKNRMGDQDSGEDRSARDHAGSVDGHRLLRWPLPRWPSRCDTTVRVGQITLLPAMED